MEQTKASRGELEDVVNNVKKLTEGQAKLNEVTTVASLHMT